LHAGLPIGTALSDPIAQNFRAHRSVFLSIRPHHFMHSGFSGFLELTEWLADRSVQSNWKSEGRLEAGRFLSSSSRTAVGSNGPAQRPELAELLRLGFATAEIREVPA
jgi:hypothetical protein